MDSLSLGCGEGAFAEPEVPQLPPPAFAVDCSDSDSSDSAANDVQGASPSDQVRSRPPSRLCRGFADYLLAALFRCPAARLPRRAAPQ